MDQKFLTSRQTAATGILSEHHLRMMEKQGRLFPMMQLIIFRTLKEGSKMNIEPKEMQEIKSDFEEVHEALETISTIWEAGEEGQRNRIAFL